ncbi:hypothetical protein [Nannocystis pusilla]|uniref:Uncharacterized protein n=1 Tax=Nannocystis pusilla TaxID=889268 RepID=A0ABS7TNU5_9BACT|nr:hypothetical protein [Nannocystis pusilla]MBZ5709904.1 hypothetical protein [Nannocystis pusilla]
MPASSAGSTIVGERGAALSPAGVVLWEVTLPSPAHMHAVPSDVIVTTDGGPGGR